jgi:hypothetical protein
MTDPVLLLSPGKVLARFGVRRLLATVPDGSVILTSDGWTVPDLPGMAHLQQFPHYTANDWLPIVAGEMITKFGLSRVVALAEADVLRAADLRAAYDLAGQRPAQALPYRDKVEMKRRVAAAGVRVAPHRRVTTGPQLLAAVEELGLPGVVKPPQGRGSAGVEVLHTMADLERFLAAGPYSDHGHEVPWVYEAFVEGDLYRVDGVHHDGKPLVVSVARYIGTHLDFLNGGYLGSVILPEDSPQFRTLADTTRLVVSEALPALIDGGFHLEAFLTPDGVVFNEVAARLGGGSIPEEVELAYGVNLVEAAIRAQAGLPPATGIVRQLRLAGQVNMSPRHGTLVAAPSSLRHPSVVFSEVAPAGTIFTAMTHTNGEFARAVFQPASVSDAAVIVDHLVTQLNEECVWC